MYCEFNVRLFLPQACGFPLLTGRMTLLLSAHTKRKLKPLPKNPLAEVFGYTIGDISANAKRHRKKKLCPFNNIVPQCTKDKKASPLGVCSLYVEGAATPTIICPIRFREGAKDEWHILKEAANFFFPAGTRWMPLGEVTLHNKSGISAGKIDGHTFIGSTSNHAGVFSSEFVVDNP